MRATILISIGAVFGANLRYWVGLLFLRLMPGGFPTGTLVINVTGSLVLGLFAAFQAGRLLESSNPRLLIAVGFCGAYTTFSAFSMEMLGLLESRSFGLAALYLLGSCAGGVLGVLLGYAVGGLLRPS